MMKELFTLCEKGDGEVNEDVCGVCGAFAWVIDGATDVFHRKALFPCHEVSRYVNMLNDRISQYAARYRPEEPQKLLSDAIRSLYAELNIDGQLSDVPEYELPTFAAAVVSVSEDTLHYALIGDCFVSYLTERGVQMITDMRISKFSRHNRTMLKAYHAHSDAPFDMQTVYQNTRRMANRADGYPIGSIRGSGMMQAMTGTISLPSRGRFLICSDGCLDYYRNNAAGNLNFFDPETIRTEIGNMNRFLADELRFQHAPRPKKKDDCTIMLLEV